MALWNNSSCLCITFTCITITSPVQSLHLYNHLTCTITSPVQSPHLYNHLTCTITSPVQSLHLYNHFTCTITSPVQSLHLYNHLTCITITSPVQSLHLYNKQYQHLLQYLFVFTCTISSISISMCNSIFLRLPVDRAEKT